MSEVYRFDSERLRRIAPAAARYLRARDIGRYEPSPLPNGAIPPFVLLDVYGRILDIAPAVADQLEFGRERLLGRRFVHRMGPAWRCPFQLALSLLRNELDCPPLECALRTRANERHVVTLAFTRTRGDSGETMIVVEVRGLIARPPIAP
jgi:PAS domain-containing protein